MKTEISRDSDLAAALLLRDEVVAFATETVYGLGGNLFSKKAVEKIFTIKGRPRANPLIAHVLGVSDALELIENPPPLFFTLANEFWPGPLTLVLEKRGSVPATAPEVNRTIALRSPKHPKARELLEKVKCPLVAPSANLSGRPSPTTAFEVLEDLEGKIPLILEGGPSEIGIESTVLSLSQGKIKILRPGSITKEALEEVLKQTIEEGSDVDKQEAPGARYCHYAPDAKVKLVFSEKECEGEFLLSRVPLLGKKSYPLSQKTLYSLLREADRQGKSEITVFCDAEVEKDLALMNRLHFASNPKKGVS